MGTINFEKNTVGKAGARMRAWRQSYVGMARPVVARMNYPALS